MQTEIIANSSPVKRTTITRSGFYQSMILCLLLMTNAADCQAAGFPNTLSLQGYTGLLNTPNAEVTDEGEFIALFSDQKESQWRALTPRQDNYMFSVGLFPFAEIGGRFSDVPRTDVRVRDLSANIKIKVPLPRGYLLPDVAFGIQDVGGSAAFLRTKYVTATEEWWRFRLSLGVGTGPTRMQGVFGGVEFKAYDQLFLIAENDARETNAGVRLVVQDLFGRPVSLQLTAKTSLNYRPGRVEFGFGLQVPLGNEHRNRTPLTETAGDAGMPAREGTTGSAPVLQRDRSEPAKETVPALREPQTAASAPVDGGAALLKKRLIADGFQNVRIGTREGQLLVVEYENSRYNYNELDGLGVVLGSIMDTVPPGYETLRLIVRKQNIAIFQLTAPLEAFRAFLVDPGKEQALNEKLVIARDIEDDVDVDFIAGPGNPSRLTSSLVVYPGLKTFVGTEAAAFDYLVSAKLEYYLTTWKGAVVNARWDLPLFWSENFDDGKIFANYRSDSRLERLMLFQAVRLSPAIMANLGAGMVLHDSYGTINEVMVTPGDGTHRFLFRQAAATSPDRRVVPHSNESYLGSYRYYYGPLDLFLSGTVGRFFYNDKGYTLEVKRLFGDTAFSVFYKNTQTPLQENVQIAGVMAAFPLGFRRDMKPGPVQLRGSDEWSYSQETRIAKTGQANTITIGTGIDPKPGYNLEHVFFNRDRLSEAYIRGHLLRLRDAFITYLKQEQVLSGAAGPQPGSIP